MVKGGDDDSVDEVPVKRGIPSQITASREEDEEADGISSQSADSTNLLDNKHESVDVVEQGRSLKEPDQPGLAAIPMVVAPEQPKDDGANGANDSAEVIIPCEKKISDMRKQRWISLLAKRPSTKDGDSMSGWLMEVLAVSDLETPLKVSENTEEDAKLKATKKREKSDEPQKRSEKIANDSHPSDSGDSTNDESVSNDNKKLKKEKDPPIAFNGGIVKKKRPSADLLRDGSEQKTKSGSYVRGSFAEWKERKKQKKQSKSGNNSTQQDAT